VGEVVQIECDEQDGQYAVVALHFEVKLGDKLYASRPDAESRATPLMVAPDPECKACHGTGADGDVGKYGEVIDIDCSCRFRHLAPGALASPPAPAQPAAAEAEPDWCAAGPNVCEYGPHGRKGEMQCRWCAAPQPAPAQPSTIDIYADHQGTVEALTFLPAGTKLYAALPAAPVAEIRKAAQAFLDAADAAHKEQARLYGKDGALTMAIPAGLEDVFTTVVNAQNRLRAALSASLPVQSKGD
jgi:hypothetical protein